MDPREIMRATDAIGKIGAVFYFHPDTLARGKEAGLDGFRLYFLGRGGVLGDVEPGVVRAAFGYFQSDLVEKMWNSGKEIVAPREAARHFIAAGHDLARGTLADVDGLDAFVDAVSHIIGQHGDAGLSLFAGVRAEPVPDDAPAAALHQAMVLRELRGSVHLAALTVCGVRDDVAHAIKRPDDLAMFGYEAPPAVTEADRANWQRAEELTDDVLAPSYASLTDSQAAALIEGTAAIAAAFGL